MKSGHVAILALLVFSSIGVLPGVAAAATTVPGVQAIVTEGGDPATIELKWRVSVDDPDQVDGSYTYNVTIDNGTGWVNLGASSGLSGFDSGAGFQSVEVGLTGSTTSNDFNVTVDDGTGPVSSCQVTVDSGVAGDYDLCGTLDVTWNQVHCLDRTGSENTGFDTEKRIYFNAADDELEFRNNLVGPAYGGKALGGDTGSYGFDFSLRAATDGASSRVVGMFSSVNNPVIEGAAGNFKTTGTFSDGVSFTIDESGSEWDLTLYSHVSGARTPILAVTLTGTDPNDYGDGRFSVNAYSGIVSFSLGSEEYAFSEAQISGGLSDSLRSFWLGGSGITFLTNPSTFVSREANSLCFNTLSAEFGGGSADFIPQGQPIETFPGAGGAGGDPLFPGLDVETFSDTFEVGQELFALALMGLLLMVAVLLGFLAAGPGGAVLGALCSVVLGAFLNLIPYWFIVVAFLLAITFIILGRSK